MMAQAKTVTRRRWSKTGHKVLGILILTAWLVSVAWLLKPTATLTSLVQVDDYPLYTMHYSGAFERATSASEVLDGLTSTTARPNNRLQKGPAWACSLFAAWGDPDHKVYGRNFDWRYSPALLLFTDPPQGYASISMVDIAYLGFNSSQVRTLTRQPLLDRRPLLYAPYLPFDGMNEHGLAIGMAAVPPGGMQPDPGKETIDSLMVMRIILDHARNVDEAIGILQSYNIDMGGGPPIHYLIADASGKATLIEFHQGQMEVIPNLSDWHQATNFLVTPVKESPLGRCQRYDTIHQRLTETEGQLRPRGSMALLDNVSQNSTQWSVIYEMSSGKIHVAMGRAYDEVYTFKMKLRR
jgi:hypothetical protein